MKNKKNNELAVCGFATVKKLEKNHPEKIRRLYFTAELAPKFGGLCKRLAQNHGIYNQKPAADLEKLSGTVHHQGVVAMIDMPDIQPLDSDITEIEQQIKSQVQDSPIATIPGISFRMAAMIQAEIGDFSRFSSPDKILALAGLSTTYQSGSFIFSISFQYVSMWCPVFKDYYRKKRAEGKHCFVAFSHVAKKLVRIICHLQKTGESFKIFLDS